MKLASLKIPVLMYHEVSKPFNGESELNYMTPRYDIPVSMFKKQMALLSRQGYRCLLFDEVLKIKVPGRYVMLTFDDGLQGNFSNAFPILKKYDFKATFFVHVGSVGTERFMNWSELQALAHNGMSVQSHTMSHRPLENLGAEEIRRELDESSRILEQKLNSSISLLSLPHGSYNTSAIDIAKKSGYRALFTSTAQIPELRKFFMEPAVLGRIAMTNALKLTRFSKIVQGNKVELFRQRAVKSIKSSIRSHIGIENYRYLYRMIFNIKKSDNS